MNKLKKAKTKEIVKTPDHKTAPDKKKTSYKVMNALNLAGFIEKDMLIKILPFVFFLTGIALVYISNSYYAERTIRNIDHSAKEIKELRSEYIYTKSELMFKSNQSQVAAAVLPLGLKETRVAPKKIVINEQINNEK